MAVLSDGRLGDNFFHVLLRKCRLNLRQLTRISNLGFRQLEARHVNFIGQHRFERKLFLVRMIVDHKSSCGWWGGTNEQTDKRMQSRVITGLGDQAPLMGHNRFETEIGFSTIKSMA